VTELELLFEQLVRNLAAINRSRLQEPLPLTEIRNSIIPYRANRRALKLESSEDYELVLMRLCAGEGGFARTEPAESRVEFEMEVGTPNPDLTLVERHEKAVLHLDPRAVAKVLDPAPDLTYAPKQPASASSSGKHRAERNKAAAQTTRSSPQRCSRCGAGLPTGRPVNFCPQCGQNLAQRRCANCQTELEPGWRHCVSCGTPVGP
jgi:hypothetical protein